MKFKAGIMTNKGRFLVLPLTTLIILALFAGSGKAGTNADFSREPAPWDGFSPRVTIYGRDHAYSFLIVPENFHNTVKLRPHISIKPRELYLFSICRKKGEGCLLETPEGELMLTDYNPEKSIAGTLRIQHSQGEETITFSARYSQ